MTREQAIKFANCLKNNYTIDIYAVADFCDMVINALEIVEEFERARIITGGRLNGRTYAYKCGLEDGKRKALEQQPSEDCVSRKAMLNAITEIDNNVNMDIYTNEVREIVKELPPVTPTQRWIPIITREPIEEEKKYYFEQNGGELCYMIDSPMPDNGQEVLVSGGDYVSEDVFDEDFWNFENRDIENVEAWMPKPKAYKKSEVMRNESNN